MVIEYIMGAIPSSESSSAREWTTSASISASSLRMFTGVYLCICFLLRVVVDCSVDYKFREGNIKVFGWLELY